MLQARLLFGESEGLEIPGLARTFPAGFGV